MSLGWISICILSLACGAAMGVALAHGDSSPLTAVGSGLLGAALIRATDARDEGRASGWGRGPRASVM
jgi:hypothetical protein